MILQTDIQPLIAAIHSGRLVYLLTDSRSLSVPEQTVFFALTTPHGDGHHYIQQLYDRGVRHFVVRNDDVERQQHWQQHCPDAVFHLTSDTLAELQYVVAKHRQQFHIPVVGITGSNGKTIVKEWLYQLLSPDKMVTRSPRSYNSQIGVPLSVFLLNKHSQIGVFEAGISRVGEMQRIAPVIDSTIGVLTNIGAAHQEHFASLEQKLQEKLQLFVHTPTIVYCTDDALIGKEMIRQYSDRTLIGWSMHDAHAPIYIYGVRHTAHTISFSCQAHVDGLPAQFAASIPFTDEASLHNAVNAAVVALLLGMPADVVTQRLQQLEPVAMRLEVKQGVRRCTVINDSYNSDLPSLDIALDFMHRRTDALRQHCTLVLSDIDQSGLRQEQLYGEVADLIHHRGVGRLVTVGPHLAQCRHLFAPTPTVCFNNVNELIASQLLRELHDEIILLKGARRFRFEQLAELLAEKVHETTLEVDLTGLVDNLNHYRSLLRPTTRLMCMIKADAYGAGAIEVAKTLAEHHVDYLAVAVADEGVALRAQGITTSVVVMNPEVAALRTLFDYRLQPEVYSFRILDALIEEGRREGIVNFPIHIKIDTGMHRLGFHPIDDLPLLIERLQHQRVLLPSSVFTHFVGADSDDFDDYSQQQYQLFTSAADSLQAAFSHHILRHINNSAGIEHFPEWQLNMCRLGLGLYGVSPRGYHLLHNVLTLRTTILQIHALAAGETVGYSRRTTLQRDSRVAAIPIGYADGLSRQFGNGNAYCIVNGKQAPYVGNICMDVAMIDVTDITCQEGDSVEIFGLQLPITTLANVAHTIPYEVMTAVSNRVKRIYYRE